MKKILGIDTGGTYTDSVVIDATQKTVLSKNKSFTTKENLSIGIRNSIKGLEIGSTDDIAFVSISTTLATNAVVEGKGCSVGLVLIGEKLEKEIPAELIVEIPGKIDICGRIQEEIEEQSIVQATEVFKNNVDAVVVSGFASVRNPVHEQKVAEIIKMQTKIPVMCAHELTSLLGFYDRTITAVLNARLIPIISNMLEAVEEVLKEFKIKAPVMIVKGDGCLMRKELAQKRPIETILSGPAASVMGAMALSDCKDSIVVDMGGTTTDVAYLNKGNVKLSKKGAKVGGWQTCIKSAEISTFGIGGDSYIRYVDENKLKVGPERVIPLSVVGIKYPELYDEIVTYKKPDGWNLVKYQETDCFMIINLTKNRIYSDEEEAIIEILLKGPVNIFHLADAIDKDADKICLNALIKDEIIAHIGITPTCVLCAEGKYKEGSKAISLKEIEILSKVKNHTVEECMEYLKQKILRKICLSYMQSICDFQGGEHHILSNEKNDFILDGFYQQEKQGLLTTIFKINKPILGIGAPADTWIKNASNLLNTESIIPNHNEVANAVGAAIGNVKETVEVIVRFDKTISKYVVYSPKKRMAFNTAFEAIECAKTTCKSYVNDACMRAGSSDIDIIIGEKDIVHSENPGDDNKGLLEATYFATGVGKPDFMNNE